MAALAYVPALTSSPGRMPTDTKLYLYLDPRRLVADSIWTFDGRQFAGWVPHQVIAYLWPSGPWYVAAQAVGLPDWVAHRLWIGTIMFAAGAGVAWAARRLGLSVAAAVAAGLVYQLSPYLVPYVSRTSSMLLPWAGLGWIVGLTVGAATRSRWRDAALAALVIATVGNVNATALAMIAPAPVLWLVLAVADRTVTARRALGVAARLGGLAVAASAWWITMLVIQGREGADLLDFSESLEDVSYTATASEVWRSLGYWLLYVRDAYAPTTTAGRDYMVDGRPLVLGFVVVVVGLVGLATTRFAARRFAALAAFAGLVLGVGVHPFADPSPVAAFLTGDGESGLALALRSSTRALPLLTLGLGLGAGALVDALAAARVLARRPVVAAAVRLAAAAAVVLIALGNMPVLTGHRLVDPALERDEDPPAAWSEAAAALDALPPGYRVLQLPGAEFGAFRWGYTVDPPLPAMTDRPLVTRDLLPLGSPSTMDLLYAFDDRFQTGRPEAAAIAAVARLLGADTIWLTGDAAFDRFRTPRPELVAALFGAAGGEAAGAGLGEPVPYGVPVVNAPDVPMVDEQALSEPAVGDAMAPVELVTVTDPVAVVRASADVVLMSGSGDGIVDAAAAGLIDGTEAILYSAAFGPDELAALAPGAGTLIVTDANRARAHHWRSSQDVVGYTEAADGSALLWPDPGDARLVVFPDAPPAAFTTSRADGPVAVRATSYGDRFSYQPEARPALAVDGDPDTAWTVLDPTNQYIELTTDTGVDQVTLLQPNGLQPVRRLAGVRVSVNGGDPFDVALDERSLVVGQPVTFPPTDGPTTVRITLGPLAPAPATGRPDRTPVGFAEIDTGLGPSPEVVVVPTDLTDALAAAGEPRVVTYVLTRERVRPTNRWRADPEATIVREIEVPFDQDVAVAVDVRLDRRASDAVLAELVGIEGPTASARLTGAPAAAGWAAADGDPATAWITPFNDVAGATLTVSLVDPGAPLRIRQPGGNYSTITRVRLRQGGAAFDLGVPAPDERGWSAVPVPAGFVAGPTVIEIVGLTEHTTRDRRFGDTVLMPAAVTELDNVLASDVPEEFATRCRDDLVAIDGTPVAVRVAGSVAGALAGEVLTAEVCDGAPVALGAGAHRVTGQAGRRSGLQTDRIVLAGVDPEGTAVAPAGSGAAGGPAATVVESGRRGRTVEVTGCASGCWLILGEGYHHGWSASLDGASLGPPTLVSGGFNGWWIPAGGEATATMGLTWTVQRPLDAALVVSALAGLAAVVLAVADRSVRPPPAPAPARFEPIGPSDGLVRAGVAAATYAVAAGLFVTPGWALAGAAGGALVLASRRVRVAGYVAALALVVIAHGVVTTVRRDHPPVSPGFPGHFDHLHHLGLFAAVSLAVSVLGRRREV